MPSGAMMMLTSVGGNPLNIAAAQALQRLNPTSLQVSADPQQTPPVTINRPQGMLTQPHQALELPPFDPKVDYMGLYLDKYLCNKQLLATFTQECVARNAVLEALISQEGSAPAFSSSLGAHRLSPLQSKLPHLFGTLSPSLIHSERIAKLTNDPRAYVTPLNEV